MREKQIVRLAKGLILVLKLKGFGYILGILYLQNFRICDGK